MKDMDNFKTSAEKMGYDPKQVDAFMKIVEQFGSNQPSSSSSYEAPVNYPQPTTASDIVPGQISSNPNQVFGSPGRLTQSFGVSNPSLYGTGTHLGTDYGMKLNTPVSVPAGDWVVDQVIPANKGGAYGNSIIVKNRLTGETIRYSHLNTTKVKPGELVRQGAPIGYSGTTGKSTGPHVDVEYRNSMGSLGDIRKSPYSKNF